MEEIKARLTTLEARVSRLEAKKKAKKPLTEEEWFAELKAIPVYSGIDIDREYGKMTEWCKARSLQPTRRRFVNWLNREDRPLLGRAPGTERYRDELVAALKNEKNTSMPSCTPSLSAEAKRLFYSLTPPIHWRDAQQRLLRGENLFGQPPVPAAAPDFKAKAAGDE